jgi:protease I
VLTITARISRSLVRSEQGAKIMAELSEMPVAALVTDGFEESELVEPMSALQKAGAHVQVIAPKPGNVQAFRHFDKARTVPV